MKRFLSLVPVVCILLTCILPVSASSPVASSGSTYSGTIGFSVGGYNTAAGDWQDSFFEVPITLPRNFNNAQDSGLLYSSNYYPIAPGFSFWDLRVNDLSIPAGQAVSLYFVFGWTLGGLSPDNGNYRYSVGGDSPGYWRDVSFSSFSSFMANSNYWRIQYFRPGDSSPTYFDDFSFSCEYLPSFLISTSDGTASSIWGGPIYSVSVSCETPEAISSFVCAMEGNMPMWMRSGYMNSPGGGPFNLAILPTATFVVAEDSGIIEMLEAIASTLIGTNSVLQAFKGEVVNLLNELRTKLGSIEAAEDMANTYLNQISQKLDALASSQHDYSAVLSQIRSLLQSIDADTSKLSGDVSDIYALTSAYLHYLTDIADSVDNLDAEMQLLHADLNSKLDQILSILGAELPGSSDTNDKINQGQTAIEEFDQLEQSYVSSLNTSFDNIDFGTTFDGGFVDGFTLYRGLFMEFWDALGTYAILYTIPLILGIALLVVGRVSAFVPPEPKEPKK